MTHNPHTEWGHGNQVRVLLDSVNPKGIRLVTWVLKYHRFIHSEMLTHRIFSKCSSSSRAIPIEKMIEAVRTDPAMPVYYGKNQSGMQAKQKLGEYEKEAAIEEWLAARDNAILHTKELLAIGLHKQLANRVLEPWMWITVVLSTTSHSNFFALRDHPDAQPEIAHLARLMRVNLLASKPRLLLEGEWHLPFIKPSDRQECNNDNKTLIEISTARCARVSYLNHDGIRSISRDVELYSKLATSIPPHASAFEHPAMAMNNTERYANFVGFIQHRRQLANECARQEIYDGDLATD